MIMQPLQNMPLQIFCFAASCGPAPELGFTERSISEDGLTASYRCQDHFNHTIGGTELVLKCSSLDPGNFPSEWRPVSNVAMICSRGKLTVHHNILLMKRKYH